MARRVHIKLYLFPLMHPSLLLSWVALTSTGIGLARQVHSSIPDAARHLITCDNIKAALSPKSAVFYPGTFHLAFLLVLAP